MPDFPNAGPARYDFLAPPTILFGAGRFTELGEVVARLGREAWLVTGSAGLAACGGQPMVAATLRAAGLDVTHVGTCTGEPTVADVAGIVRRLPPLAGREPVIVAIGGGATIDLAKAVAALATNQPHPQDCDDDAVADHLEGVGRGLPIVRHPLALVAVPTTAGTGAEATRNAVISCPHRRIKKSMRSPLLVPRAALVDPALTVSCPRSVTAASGLDAVTQLVESFICRFRAPLPRALVLDALPRAMEALPRALADPLDLDARAAMSHAALVSGMALTNSGLGMAHGVAAALGIECGTPHGIACAMLLPVAVAVNRSVCENDFALLERAVDPDAPRHTVAAADAFVRRITDLCSTAGIPRRLADVGLSRDRLAWLAENSGGASMRGNPVSLDPQTLLPILERVW